MHKSKINEISLLTSILCIFVIFAHISSQAINTLDKSSLQLSILYFFWRNVHFAVPCFIMVSAIKMYIKHKNTVFHFVTYMNFIKERILNIFVPYALWVMVYYIYFYSIGYVSVPFKISDYIGYLFRGDLSSPFYFIIVIMQFYLTMPIWIFITNKFNPKVVIIISALVMVVMIYKLPNILNTLFNTDFRYNDRIFTSYLLYWVLGLYIGKFYNEFKKFIIDKRFILWICFFILAFLDGILSFIQFKGLRIFYYLEFIHVIYCVCAILSFYIICIYISNKNNFITFILYNINSCSFYIYLSHCLILTVVERQLYMRGINDIGQAFIIKAFFVYSISLMISNIYVNLKRKLIDLKYN